VLGVEVAAGEGVVAPGRERGATSGGVQGASSGPRGHLGAHEAVWLWAAGGSRAVDSAEADLLDELGRIYRFRTGRSLAIAPPAGPRRPRPVESARQSPTDRLVGSASLTRRTLRVEWASDLNAGRWSVVVIDEDGKQVKGCGTSQVARIHPVAPDSHNYAHP
jgi:hypothetical protein